MTDEPAHSGDDATPAVRPRRRVSTLAIALSIAGPIIVTVMAIALSVGAAERLYVTHLFVGLAFAIVGPVRAAVRRRPAWLVWAMPAWTFGVLVPLLAVSLLAPLGIRTADQIDRALVTGVLAMDVLGAAVYLLDPYTVRRARPVRLALIGLGVVMVVLLWQLQGDRSELRWPRGWDVIAPVTIVATLAFIVLELLWCRGIIAAGRALAPTRAQCPRCDAWVDPEDEGACPRCGLTVRVEVLS